ncbi:MAG: SHOCT domain-containing protein [Solirubrobacterales bacterium]|nr:SHOCT domain-containing protein [Solirubrobacterales bacterium]
MNSQTPESGLEPVEEHRGGRLAANVLIVIATILSVISLFAVWADRQILNADNWSNTSTQLLKNKTIRDQTALFITNEIYKNVDVQAEIEKALPDQAQILAGPASDALRNLAQSGIEQALATSAVQSVWKAAHKELSQQVIDIVNQIRQAAIDIGSRVGLKSQAEKIKPGQASVTVFSSDQIGKIRSVAQFLEAVSVIFPLLAFLLFGCAVAVNRGRRRRTVLVSSFALILASLIALATRGIAEGVFIDAVAPTDASRPSAQATWSIATDMLQSIAANTITIAVIVILFLTLGGRWKFATEFRRLVAPWTNQRPELSYGFAYTLLLLFLIWGPIPSTRQWVTVLIFIALVGAGVWGLRRMTLAEFPEANSDEAVERLRSAWVELKDTLSSGVSSGAESAAAAARQVRDRKASPDGPVPASEETTQVMTPRESATTETMTSGGESGVDALVRLAALHKDGSLTDEEFTSAKAKLL